MDATPFVVVGAIISLGILVWLVAPRIDPTDGKRRWMLWILVPFGVVVFLVAYWIST
jgi:hypothetical protein